MSCWTRTAFFTRVMVLSQVVTYVLSWLLWGVIQEMINRPYYVVRLHLWQLVTSPFATINCVNLVFSLIGFWGYSIKKERQMGTALYIVYCMLNSLICNGIYLGVILLLAMFIEGMTMKPMCGLWPLVMVNFVVVCNRDPEEQRQFMFFPYKITSKYMPLVFVGFFVLLFQTQAIGIVIGVVVGYLNVLGKLAFAFDKVNDQILSKIEHPAIANNPLFVKKEQASSNDEFVLFDDGKAPQPATGPPAGQQQWGAPQGNVNIVVQGGPQGGYQAGGQYGGPQGGYQAGGQFGGPQGGPPGGYQGAPGSQPQYGHGGGRPGFQ